VPTDHEIEVVGNHSTACLRIVALDHISASTASPPTLAGSSARAPTPELGAVRATRARKRRGGRGAVPRTRRLAARANASRHTPSSWVPAQQVPRIGIRRRLTLSRRSRSQASNRYRFVTATTGPRHHVSRTCVPSGRATPRVWHPVCTGTAVARGRSGHAEPRHSHRSPLPATPPMTIDSQRTGVSERPALRL
jgi:hypothetical protein